jgi:hypothetical protein
MIARTYSPNSKITQRQIATYVKGKNNIMSGVSTAEDLALAVTYASGKTFKGLYKAVTQAELRNSIENGDPVVRGAQKYKNGSSKADSGHATLICGYIISGNTYKYIEYDPEMGGDTFVSLYGKLVEFVNYSEVTRWEISAIRR